MSSYDNLITKLRSWSYHRQQLGGAASSPVEALHSVIAVYSSHPTAPLTLLSRSKPFEAEHFREMEQRREALRLPAMRQSIFLMPTATATRIFAATRQPLDKRARALQYAGLDQNEYARLKQLILEYTQEPITAGDLQKAIKTDAKLMIAVRTMSYEGLVFRLGSSLRTDSLLYIATEAWLGHPLEEIDFQHSLHWLAHEYLRCYGPVRVKDFAWWSGVSNRSASSALHTANIVDIGSGLLLHADQQEDFEHVEPIDTETLDVLPKWDAYTMGYAPDGRQRLVEDKHLARAYSGVGTPGKGGTSGDGLPLVLQAGRAIASWSHRFEGNRMQVKVVPFEYDGPPSTHYEHTFDAVGKLLGAMSIEVATASN